jgi:hypothetical protein
LGFVVRYRRVLMIAGAIAVLAGIGLLVNLTSHDTTPGPRDVAPARDVAAEIDSERQESTARQSTPQASKPSVVEARGLGGRRYSCPVGVIAEIAAAGDRADRREKVLDARRDALRAVERQYPDGTAPGPVVDRYDRLLALTNAQVKFANRAIRDYNNLLEGKCDK